METGRRCLSLTKGRHHYVFWYSAGQEAHLLATLVELAQSAGTNFDWLDAAVLSYQMGKRIGDTKDRHIGVCRY
jgi:hypothetical protein